MCKVASKLKMTIACAAIALSCMSVYAGDSGSWKDANGVTWKFDYSDGNGEAIIRGGVSGYTDTLDIPATVRVGSTQYTVTAIGSEAFSASEDPGLKNVKTVMIPDTVMVINEGAFEYCNGITNLVLGECLEEICVLAFYRCARLESVVIPASVTRIHDYAFQDCFSFTGARFENGTNGITMDPYRAFSGTPYLERVNANDDVNDAVVITGTEGRITACNDLATMQTIKGQDEQTYVGLVDWMGNPVKRSLWWEWMAPVGVTEVAFYTVGSECDTAIGVYCNSADTISRGKMGTSSDYAGWMFAFVRFAVTPGETYYICVAAEDDDSGDVCLGWKASTGKFSLIVADGILFGFFGTCPKSIAIPDSVACIADNAFDYYFNDSVFNLKSLVMPESVASILCDAFWGCEGLASVTFRGRGLRFIDVEAFWACYALAGKTITLPASVENVYGNSFGEIGGALTVEAPESLADMFTSGEYGDDSMTTLTVSYYQYAINGWVNVVLYPEGGTFDTVPINDDEISTTVKVQKGSTYWKDAISRKPKRKGYVFDGFWTEASGGKQIWDADMKYVSGTGYWSSDGKWSSAEVIGMPVYAHWKAPELAIGGGKTSMSRSYSCEAKKGESFSVACSGSWTATRASSWITITSGAWGTGSGKVTYSLAENAGTSQRRGTITIKCGGVTRTCTITQDKPLLIGGKTSMSRTYDAAKQAGCYFSVTCSQSPWTAVSSASWVTLKSGSASGTGSGKVYYDVAANTSASQRTATIKVTSRGLTRTCTITQRAEAEPTLTIGGGKTSMSRAYSCEAKSGESFSVACNGSWTATASASWIKVTSGASGSGNGTVKYSLAENTGTSKREGTIKVKCGGITRTCAITQDKPLLVGGKTSMSRTYEASKQSGCYFSVTCSQSSWTAVSSASWVTLKSGSASGTGSGKIYYDVAANTSTSQRTATIKVTSRGLTRTCTIKQKGK